MSRNSPSLRLFHFTSGAAIFHGLLALLALGYLLGSISMGVPINNGQLTPSFFPFIVGALVSCLCMWQWAAEIFSSRKDAVSAVTEENSLGASYAIWRKPEVKLIAVTAVYVLSFTTAGYWLSTLLYVYAVMLLFAGLKKWLIKGFISLVITALGYLLFSQLFNVRLPLLWG